MPFLAFKFLQQIRFQVRATGYFENFKQDVQCGVMVGRIFVGDEIRHLGVQILKAQQSAHALIERKIIANHNARKAG